MADVAEAQHVVPLRDEIVQRAAQTHALVYDARLAEGYAAVHAPRTLRLLFVAVQRNMKFIEILDTTMFYWYEKML